MKNIAIVIIFVLGIPSILANDYISPYEGKEYSFNIKEKIIEKIYKPLFDCFPDSLIDYIRNIPRECVDSSKGSYLYDCKSRYSLLWKTLHYNSPCFEFSSKYLNADTIGEFMYNNNYANIGILVRKYFYYYLNNFDFDIRPELDSGLKKEFEYREQQLADCQKDSLEGVYIPYDLNDALSRMNIFWSDSALIQFKLWDEDDAVGYEHLGTATNIRLNWYLWGGSRLWKYFADRGIANGDRISSVLVKLYHRKINNKDLNVDVLIEAYKKSEIIEVEQDKKRTQEDYYLIEAYKQIEQHRKEKLQLQKSGN